MRSSLLLPLAGLMVAIAVIGSAALRDDRVSKPAPAASAPVDPPVVMVRSARPVTPSWARRAAAVPGVEQAVYVRRGQAMLRRSVDASGRTVQAVRPGYGIPLDTLVADPRRYAPMVPSPAREVIAGLGRSDAVLSRSAALVRNVGTGGVLTIDGGRLRVAGVVDDAVLNGAELLTPPGGRGIQMRAAVVLARGDGADVRERVIDAFAHDQAGVIWRGQAYGPAAAPIVQPVELKARFGEVAARVPFARDWVELDPGWVRRNIVRRTVPILGVVRCNRVVMQRLSGALGELRDRGLASLVDPGDFAGCYAPRRIPATGALSLHALGLAVDINAHRNPYAGRSRQDPRLVSTMRRWGFVWGGAWPTVKDPMHFEFQGG